MVGVTHPRSAKRYPSFGKYFLVGLVALTVTLYGFWFVKDPGSSSGSLSQFTVQEEEALRHERIDRTKRPPMVRAGFDVDNWGDTKRNLDKPEDDRLVPCGYQSIDDFTPEERMPVEGIRHMIAPPKGGKVSHVCCVTSKGPLSFSIHHKWAPIGAQRVKDMVTSGYFSFGQGVPLMRCVRGFLCQFGIHSDPSKRKEFNDGFVDDVNWLPEGPNYRENSDGVKRFARGYMAFAGGGKNSRSKQLIMALADNGPLGGGSPWEVPWGEVVGDYSFDTMAKIYTGYGEDGPPQGKLSKEGASAEVKAQWPLLDYIQQCVLVDERVLDDNGNTVLVDE